MWGYLWIFYGRNMWKLNGSPLLQLPPFWLQPQPGRARDVAESRRGPARCVVFSLKWSTNYITKLINQTIFETTWYINENIIRHIKIISHKIPFVEMHLLILLGYAFAIEADKMILKKQCLVFFKYWKTNDGIYTTKTTLLSGFDHFNSLHVACHLQQSSIGKLDVIGM